MSIPGTALALLGAYGSYKSAKNKNSRISGADAPFASYSGYRPPQTEYLRPVEKMITETTMRRSQGQDVGYDEARRNALLQNFNIEQARGLETSNRDLQNRLSGMGLSRNAAAYNDLIGQNLRQADQEQNLYRNRVDIEDLARRNEERDLNTERLQRLNEFNFGQENRVADFDLDKYRAEQGLEAQRRGYQLQAADMYEDPWASALMGGTNMYLVGDQWNKEQAGNVMSGTGGGMSGSPEQGPTLSKTPTASGYSNSPSQRYSGVYSGETDMKKSPTYRALLNKNLQLQRG